MGSILITFKWLVIHKKIKMLNQLSKNLFSSYYATQKNHRMSCAESAVKNFPILSKYDLKTKF